MTRSGKCSKIEGKKYLFDRDKKNRGQPCRSRRDNIKEKRVGRGRGLEMLCIVNSYEQYEPDALMMNTIECSPEETSSIHRCNKYL